jgi:signal transduction histidine kinase
MDALPPPAATSSSQVSQRRAEAILAAHLDAIRRRADLLFGSLLIFLWVTALGTSGVTGGQVVAAIVLTLGIPLTFVPVGCIYWRRGTTFTRHLITVALMIWTGMLVYFSNGQAETHFLAFGSLALLAWYRDWRVLVTATLTVVVSQSARNLLAPATLGFVDVLWRALEQAGWVLFETIFLYFAISESLKHLRQLARHQADLELDRQKARSEVKKQTEKLSLKEEELRQAQKMEAVGRLAGGVAHDFNNLLTVISGYSEAMLDGHDPGDNTYQGLKEIQAAAGRAALLTRQLVAFSRKQILAPKSLDLNAVIAEMEKMLRRLIGEDVDLITLMKPRLGKVYADPGQLQQVVMNLAINARDAMPEGGKLTIETGTIIFGGGTCEAGGEPIPPGPYIYLTMTDTGCGMDESTRARIFEPFFTTKELGKGTGLGLATVYGIVRQSGGFIQVASTPGRGTAFKVCLPRTFDAVETLPEDVLASQTLRGCGTVLLVEDEESVRSLVRTILQSHGYEVIEARHGREGLELAEQHRSEIDLVLSDMVMPQMGGRQLAEHLRVILPATRVVLMSGYTDDCVLREGLHGNDFFFLQKPFRPRELLSRVQDAMNTTVSA